MSDAFIFIGNSDNATPRDTCSTFLTMSKCSNIGSHDERSTFRIAAQIWQRLLLEFVADEVGIGTYFVDEDAAFAFVHNLEEAEKQRWQQEEVDSEYADQYPSTQRIG